MSSTFVEKCGKVHAHGGTVRRVRKLNIMSKESTKRLKVMIKGLKNKRGAYIRPHYENNNNVS